jgi:hypothetical protein
MSVVRRPQHILLKRIPCCNIKFDVVCDAAENGAMPQIESEEELKRKAREAAARIAAQTQATVSALKTNC